MSGAVVDNNQEIHHLYNNHYRWLQTWLRSRLSCSEKAADLAQDTFIRMMVSKRLPKNTCSEPRALLTHIAKNLVIDYWRRQNVERAYLDALSDVSAEEAPSPETQLLIIEALVCIDAMLDSMPANTREIFLLAQLEGLTLKQISERTQVAVITVRRHIQKALVACMALV